MKDFNNPYSISFSFDFSQQKTVELKCLAFTNIFSELRNETFIDLPALDIYSVVKLY